MSSCEGMADFFREAREKVGLTQMEVAIALGYSTAQFVSNWERGKSGVPVSVLGRLISLYKLDKNRIIDLVLAAESEYLIESFNIKNKRQKG